jgi:hypothetical protein
MSFHKADEQLSLPAVKREYVSCAEGTLYMPEDAGAKLGELLQSLKGNEALLSEFESELSLVTTELVEGKNTGQMLNDETDEIAPKCFQDAAEKLISVMDMLDTMKQEVASSAHVKEPVAAIKSSK